MLCTLLISNKRRKRGKIAKIWNVTLNKINVPDVKCTNYRVYFVSSRIILFLVQISNATDWLVVADRDSIKK